MYTASDVNYFLDGNNDSPSYLQAMTITNYYSNYYAH